jgi:hypothetical protein
LRQGGLSEEYRKKLALNRAKIAIEKEKKVLKAPPPDKK